MQKASKAYKDSMKTPFRNRGYIRSTIGIINSDAQNSIQALGIENKFTYFSDNKKPFNGYNVSSVYATAEQDFSRVDGNMYFLPKKSSGLTYYNNGMVSDSLLGGFRFNFSGEYGLDIKGLTIDFGECYPTEFTIQWNGGTREYENNLQRFVTEDVFENVSNFIINAKSMVNGSGRLRVYEFTCGIAKTFTNQQVKNYSFKDYVSPITESIPSQDMSLEVDNQDLYYSVDNPDSALAFFEVGQEIRTAFGYDINGNGEIEWLPENTCYLKTWSADDVTAKFTATDRFDYLTGTYYRGQYRSDGISLYDLALDVLADAGITDEREYYLDPYLKDVIVYNPMPAVRHSEALQIIANAGRCILYQDRKKRIRIQSSFVPDMYVECNGETEFSNIENVLKNEEKDAYAMQSNDFSVTDGSVLFLPKDKSYFNTGYISESFWFSNPANAIVPRLALQLGGLNAKYIDKSGYWTGEIPKITINMEAAFVAYGLIIKFRNTAPRQFVVRTYYEDELVEEKTFEDSETDFYTDEPFDLFDRMEIEFTKGYPNSRVVIDTIMVGDIADYILKRNNDVNSVSGERKSKIKSISINRQVYGETTEEKNLKTDKVVIAETTETKTIYFTKPVFDLGVSIEVEGVAAKIVDQSSYMVTIEFSKATKTSEEIDFKITGKEYDVSDFLYTVIYNGHGEEITWSNPLISTETLAKDLEEWIATYYLGDVEYSVSWRGDPRIDAGDLMYLELKDRDPALIKATESTLEFSGAWSGSIKGRKAVVSWQ